MKVSGCHCHVDRKDGFIFKPWDQNSLLSCRTISLLSVANSFLL